MSTTMEERRESPPDAEKKPRRKIPRKYLVAGLAVAAVVVLAIYLLNRGKQSTDDAFIEGHVLEVSPQIAGLVQKVYVEDNQEVRQGDLLVELDPRDNIAVRDQAQANLESARAKYAQAQAQLNSASAALAQARADVEESRATAENDARELTRAQNLRHQGVVSQQELDQAEAKALSSKAALDSKQKRAVAAESEIQVNNAALKSAEAQVKLAEALLETAVLRLSYTKITAPEAGRVTRKNVEPGNYVQTGTPLMAVVPHEVWVVANFKETQLNHIRPGQPVDIRVDAYPSWRLKGRVDSIQKGTGARFSLLPSENATGNYVKVVQRVPVKIVFVDLPADMPLLSPGMSVIPTVHTR